MQQNGHEKRLAKIESETAQIKKQIIQLEFQSKKDIREAQRQFDEQAREIRGWLTHVAKLAGITYEELENLDLKVQEAGRDLTQPRKRSTIS